MSPPYVDTDVIIRLVTGDDREKQARARTLFKRVESGELVVGAPVTVISDAVYVLSSPHLYGFSRAEVAGVLTSLVLLPGFHVHIRRTVLAALHLYAATSKLDFGDAMIVASMHQDNSTIVYSYDHDFDRFPGVVRLEP